MSLAISTQFLLLYYSLLLLMITNSFPLVWSTRCQEDENHALLQFKEGFVISKSASYYNPMSYPKIAYWNATTDCCSRDGIECDESTGHVIGIDLSSSQLYGSVDANSSLFSLVHLQSLNLAFNDFNYSQIPSKIGELSQLRYLNLSQANFFGEIPQPVSRLSKLLSLDLCSVPCHQDVVNPLRFKISALKSLIQNSTGVETLRLNCVTVSSVPDTLTNLTSLQHLSLSHCELYGEFPAAIFHLPNLRYIILVHNQDLKGKFPDFSTSPLITKLCLVNTSFYGTLPSSIGNLKSLNWLSISECNFSGSIPSSFRNLTQLTVLDVGYNKFKGDLSSFLVNLTKLDALGVGFNEFTTKSISWICKLSRINYLDLSMVNIGSKIPSCFANLTQLYSLSLSNTNLGGQIPPWIMNMTNLAVMDLVENNLQGEIPNSLFKLENLDTFSVASNLWEGDLELDKFLELKMLAFVLLSSNKLSLISGKNPSNASLSQIHVLGLSSCNLVEVPNFLQHLSELEYLTISNNNFKSLPSWMWGKTSLRRLSISHNSLTGKISPLICNLKFLMHLDLSFNNLSDRIPSCLGSLSQSLEVQTIQENKPFGPIPQTYKITSDLKMIDFSNNNLQGQLPRALANCRMLEYLDVSHNHINDSFPFWLGTLPELKLVALHNNQLYGSIRCPVICAFPKLHIIDLSHNDFSGSLDSKVIQNWKSMKASDMSQLQYQKSTCQRLGRIFWCLEKGYSFTMSNKGMTLVYKKIQIYYKLISIDLSSNKISGVIPKVMGDLNGLISLNLSNNMITGKIPWSLGKLSNLESLDLSLNDLSGKIPQQLTQLTFLSFFNVSFNNLSGPIPQTKQFSTFQGNSFEGNQGLCGDQLLKKCEEYHSGSHVVDDPDLGSFLEFDWKVVVIGFAGGLVVGVVLGSTFSPEIFAFLKRMSLLNLK